MGSTITLWNMLRVTEIFLSPNCFRYVSMISVIGLRAYLGNYGASLLF